MRKPSTRTVFALLAIAFFVTPISLRAVGMHAKGIENREFSPRPSVKAGWAVFDQTSDFLIDRMPLRAEAVRANSWISLRLFKTAPRFGGSNDQALPFLNKGAGGDAAAPDHRNEVAVGKRGWLYWQPVLDRACAPPVPFQQAIDTAGEILTSIRASGRKVVMVVPPDKSTVYPEYLAGSTPNVSCGQSGSERLWHLLESPRNRRVGIYPLREKVLATKQRAEDPIYFRTDTHWNPIGALALPETVLPLLSDKVALTPDEIKDPGKKERLGDLTVMLAMNEKALEPRRNIERKPNAPRIPRKTLIVGDSYLEAAFPLLQPYFHNLTRRGWSEPGLGDAIVDSEIVILEIVEREFDGAASGVGHFLKLQSELAQKLKPAL